MELGTLEPDPDNAGGGNTRAFVRLPAPGGVFYAARRREESMGNVEASIAIQILPAADGDEVIRIVDKVIAYIKGTGLVCQVGPFETTIEGPLDKLWDIAKECQLICVREGAPVSAYVKSAYNPNGGVWSIAKKTAKHA
jgi:uncharacterized protein YqgV (UPF0045/DUF77 family)